MSFGRVRPAPIQAGFSRLNLNSNDDDIKDIAVIGEKDVAAASEAQSQNTNAKSPLKKKKIKKLER